MFIYDLVTLIIAAITGMLMGSFLLLTVIYKPLISDQFNHAQQILFYRRYYRLNSVIALIAGLLAALLGNQQAAFVLAILAVSYIFANMHIIKGMVSHFCSENEPESQRMLRSLKWLQNLLHFLQFIGAGYAVYYLY